MTQINEPPVDLKIAIDQSDHGCQFASEPPISDIRCMCRAINTDVPNDAVRKPAADDLITSKSAARIASVKRARRITLDDL